MRSEVQPKEDLLLSGDYTSLAKREALAIELAERLAMDPHSITDDFWQELRGEFSEQEVVELVFACSIFNWGNKFNIAMRLDTDGVEYDRHMEYQDAPTFWRR
ncbi:MAG: carboxymuconolactone decarboxylase family protein [Thermoanaerobaculia bacterium]